MCGTDTLCGFFFLANLNQEHPVWFTEHGCMGTRSCVHSLSILDLRPAGSTELKLTTDTRDTACQGHQLLPDSCGSLPLPCTKTAAHHTWLVQQKCRLKIRTLASPECALHAHCHEAEKLPSCYHRKSGTICTLRGDMWGARMSLLFAAPLVRIKINCTGKQAEHGSSRSAPKLTGSTVSRAYSTDGLKEHRKTLDAEGRRGSHLAVCTRMIPKWTVEKYTLIQLDFYNDALRAQRHTSI